MGLSPQQLSQILNRSKSIIDNEKLIESKAKNLKGSISMEDIDPSTYSDSWDNFSLSSTHLNEEYATNEAKQPLQYTNESVMNSNLPDKIKQSLIENKINISMPNDAADLDSVTKLALQQRQNNQKVRQQPINEANYPQQNNMQNGIDYNYLKFIISECIKEYFQNNPIESNGTLKQIGLMINYLKQDLQFISLNYKKDQFQIDHMIMYKI